MIKAALIGSGISGSLTPTLHKAEGAVQGLNYAYGRYDMATPRYADATLADVLSMAEQDGLAGVNVTYPFKQDVIAHLDSQTPEAVDIGAVNTVMFEAGKRIGQNTDYAGFRASFRREIGNMERADVLLAGAGGAGAAVGLALLDEGVETLHVFDRVAHSAQGLVVSLSRLRPSAEVKVWGAKMRVDGMVNATPMGMATHPGMVISLDDIQVAHWVCDIVYFPLETVLLAAARLRGLHTMTGGGMAVGQAAVSFELFTGRSADVARMTAHFQSQTKDSFQ